MIDINELRKRLFYRVDLTLEVQTIEELLDRLEAAEKERDALRAKVAEMEKQEPIDLRFPSALRKMWASYEIQNWIEEQGPLYALPGAQPAPSVPETWLEQGLKELDAIRQNSNRDDWQPNDENIVRRLYQAMVACCVQQAPSVPYGWKLVPIEPTEEMMMRDSSCQKHAHDDQSCVHRTNRRWIWKTMLAAAPEAKPCP